MLKPHTTNKASHKHYVPLWGGGVYCWNTVQDKSFVDCKLQWFCNDFAMILQFFYSIAKIYHKTAFIPMAAGNKL